LPELDWSEFFGRYRPMALSFVRGWVERHDVAEDLFQEAARAVYERVALGDIAFQSSAHLRNYFFRTLKNLAVNVLRDPGRKRTRSLETAEEVAALEMQPLEEALIAERSLALTRRDRVVADAVSKLKPHEQQVLRLRFQEGLGYREIADRTGAPTSTLHARVESALKKIRKKLGKDGLEL